MKKVIVALALLTPLSAMSSEVILAEEEGLLTTKQSSPLPSVYQIELNKTDIQEGIHGTNDTSESLTTYVQLDDEAKISSSMTQQYVSEIRTSSSFFGLFTYDQKVLSPLKTFSNKTFSVTKSPNYMETGDLKVSFTLDEFRLNQLHHVETTNGTITIPYTSTAEQTHSFVVREGYEKACENISLEDVNGDHSEFNICVKKVQA